MSKRPLPSDQDGFVQAVSKKAKKKLKKAESRPEFHFDLNGFKHGRRIGIKELRDLTLDLLLAEPGLPPPQWIVTSNKRNVEKVVVLFVPGIVPETLGLAMPPIQQQQPVPLAGGAATSQLPLFSRLYTHYCPVRAPGDKYRLHSCLQTYITMPLTAAEKQKRDKEREQQFNDKTNPSMFFLSHVAMQDSLYIMPEYDTHVPFASPDHQLPLLESGSLADWQRSDGNIQTPQKQLSPDLKLYAIDCEMVHTEEGSVLARITIVNQKLQPVYDTLVKPDKPVLDYATQWSGMTEAKLQDVTTTLRDVQEKLTSLVDYNTILIGHSLDCDLRALKLSHPWVIDTAHLYQHTRGPPFKPSLKWLAEKWLKKSIQAPTQAPTSTTSAGQAVIGHDSEEDARTAMELYNLKMKHGPHFGEFVADQQVIFERLANDVKTPRTSLVVDHGTPGQWHGARATRSIACGNDEQVVAGLQEHMADHDLVFARFLDLSHALGWSQPSTAAKSKLPFRTDAHPVTTTDPVASTSTSTLTGEDEEQDDDTSIVAATPDEIAKGTIQIAHETLNSQLTKVYDSLPPKTAFILFTGHGDPRNMVKMMAKKQKWDRLMKTTLAEKIPHEDKWFDHEERELLAEVDKCRVGMAFFAVK